jgi:hypothetical protein
VCMRVRHSSRLECKSLCVYGRATRQESDCKSLCLPLCICTSATRQDLTARASVWTCMCHLSRRCKHYPAWGLHANLSVLLANISLQVPAFNLVSATREHETANASMKTHMSSFVCKAHGQRRASSKQCQPYTKEHW